MSKLEYKELRDDVIKYLYDKNIEKVGQPINYPLAEIMQDEKLKGEHLAREYLAGKELISYDITGNYYKAKITSLGIDYVEDNNL